MEHFARARWSKYLALSGLVYLVGAVFLPVVSFEFTDYDVPDQLLAGPHVPGLTAENLKYIFTSRCVTSYYPIRSLTYAVDYELWGLHPGGFKLTNGLIHLSNTVLLFWLVLRQFRPAVAARSSPIIWQEFCVAGFSCGVFAIHPVVVEPVVWIAGREELLMTMGALACLHFHLAARRFSADGGKPRRALACYVAAAACCASACLSNAVGAVIPALIVASDLLTLPRPRLWKTLSGTSALWVIGVATIFIKRLGADASLSQVAVKTGVLWTQRPLLVLNVFWLNLKTLLCPRGLAMEYPDVAPQGFADTEVILGATAVVLTCLVLWRFRGEKPALFGLLWFGLALVPTAQIMPHHIDRADRFLYLPLVGLVLAAAMAIRSLLHRLTTRELTMATAVGVLSLFLLGMLSTHQVWTWRTSLSMWANCLQADPGNGKAHGGLADNLAKMGRYDRAFDHYRQALLLDSNDLNSLKKCALLLATCPEPRLRNYEGAIALAQRACELTETSDPGPTMILAEVYAQADRADLAATATERAIRLAEADGKPKLAGELRSRLEQYRKQTAASPPP